MMARVEKEHFSDVGFVSEAIPAKLLQRMSLPLVYKDATQRSYL